MKIPKFSHFDYLQWPWLRKKDIGGNNRWRLLRKIYSYKKYYNKIKEQ